MSSNVNVVNTGDALFQGSYINSQDPWWLRANAAGAGAANLTVSTLTVNPANAGNITIGNAAPIVFQRVPGDINGASESLVMNVSQNVPTYPTNGQFITATKMSGTAYDDIAVKGLQVYGAQTTYGNAGAYGYITGDATGVVLNSTRFTTSSIYTSSLFVGTVVSTTTGTANSYTASLWMSTPIIYAPRGVISTISTTAGLTIAGGDVRNTTGRFVVGSTFVSSANIITPAISTFNISTANVTTSSIGAGVGLFSTLNTSTFTTSTIQAYNTVVDNNVTVNGIMQTNTLGVDGNSFYRGNLTGLNSSNILLWNGDIITRGGVTTPDITLYAGDAVLPAFISTNKTTPYGMEIYSDAFTIKSIVSSPYTPLTTTTSNIITQNLIEQYTIQSPAVSTATISTGIITANQAFVNTGNVSTLNAVVANISTANISSATIANFRATEIDATTLSSLTSRVSFSLVSTLQLNANLSVSPNVNLGLGNTIAGLVGGAATQGLGVAVGTAGLATGAMALISGRQSGGANNTVFQTVNGSTQLQFSTIGTPATSVFLTTDSLDPLHTPGNPTQTSQIVPAGTYCVRSVSDPLNVDSATQGIQMFGQWVPVIQPTATIPAVAISSLTASTIFSPAATISSLTVSSLNLAQSVFPSTLFASTIYQTGNLFGTNPTAGMSWAGPAFLPSTIIKQIQFTDSNGVVSGTMLGSSALYEGINMITPNGFVIQNSNNATARFNADETMSVFSTLITQDVKCKDSIWVSTLYASTIIAPLIPNLPSTVLLSSVNVNGNLTGTNSNALLNWVGNANFFGASAQFNGFLNSGNTNVSIIRVGTDNNLIWNYGAMTYLSGGVPGVSTVTFKTNGTTEFLSTVTAPNIICTSTIKATEISTGILTVANLITPTLSVSTYTGGNMTISSINANYATLSTVSAVGMSASSIVVSSLNSVKTIGFDGIGAPYADPYIQTSYLSGNTTDIFGGSILNLRAATSMSFYTPSNTAFMTANTTTGLGMGSALGVNIQGKVTINGTTSPSQPFTVNAPLSQFSGDFIVSGTSVDSVATFSGPGGVFFTGTKAPIFNKGISSITANVSSLQVSSINGGLLTSFGVPPGAVMSWAGGGDNFGAAPPPPGWLLCDGSQYPTTTYPALYAAIGTTYNRYTPLLGYFYVPDLRFTFPMAPPTFTTSPTAMVNAPVVTVYSQPTNLGITGVLPNQIWTIVTSRNGVLAPGMYFGPNTGPNFQPAYIDRMIDGTGDVGSYIMGSVGVGTWPVIGSVGTPATQTVVGVGQGQGAEYSYKIGTINATGYATNPGYVGANDFYKWGFNINGSNVGIPGATPNVHGGIMNTYTSPVSVGGLAFPTAPNFMNMLMIIKT